MIKARLGVFVVLSILYAGLAGADTWTATGDMSVARMYHRAVLLADGRVLVSGGYCPTCGNNTYDNPTAEVYDPSTGSWSTTGSMNKGRIDHTATLLADGRVLVAVGVNANICTNDTTAELYDPTTGVWSYTGSLPFARSVPTATALVDGRVLLAGGGNRCGSIYSQASLYDPSSGNWTSTGSMTTGREYASAVRLDDGRVLVAGGQVAIGGGFSPVTSAEIYDPTSGTWSATGSMTVARMGRGWYPILPRFR